MTGIVKFFLPMPGWGFIIGDDAKEYHVHWGNILLQDSGKFRKLRKNQRVEFEPVNYRSGPKAINVKPI